MIAISILSKDKIINVPLGTSFLDINDLDFGCGVGECGSCVIEIIKGMENLSAVDEAEKSCLKDLGCANKNYRLACQCKAFGNVVINKL